ncbi:MAG: integrase catalytic domain-containing protein [Terriglobia bacterium]
MSLWKLSGGLCCKRLVPFLPDLLEALERFDEMTLCPPIKEKLLLMSISTAERILRLERRSHERGIGTTRAGDLLRHQIPIRTFEEWSDLRPGFFEIDLVAHCGGAAAGDYLYTLTMTDIRTGWTDCAALINRSQITVQAGIEAIRKRLPFALLGIDSDNGAEFINHNLKRYCDERGIKFTRCRPYKKNDQCHVEQKNGAVVRPLVGYARYEGPEAVEHLNRLYAVKRFCLNYFEPSMKLVSKTRHGARVKKEYDQPKTPFQRYIETISDEQKQQALREHYRTLNPAELRRRLAELEAGLRRFAVGSFLQEDLTGGGHHGTHA